MKYIKERQEFIFESVEKRDIDNFIKTWRGLGRYPDHYSEKELYSLCNYMKEYIVDDVKIKLEEFNRLSKQGVQFECWDYDKENGKTFLIAYSDDYVGIITNVKETKPGDQFNFIGCNSSLDKSKFYGDESFGWRCDGDDIYFDYGGDGKNFEELNVNKPDIFVEDFALSKIFMRFFKGYSDFLERYENFMRKYNGEELSNDEILKIFKEKFPKYEVKRWNDHQIVVITDDSRIYYDNEYVYKLLKK